MANQAPKRILQGGLHRSSASCQTRTSCLCGSSVPGLSSPPPLRTSCWEPTETRHIALLRSSLNKCFSHTLTSSLNIQFDPSASIISGSLCGQLQFTSQLLSVWNPENLVWKKKMYAAVGPTGQLMNYHLRDPFPQHLTLTLTGRVPKKLSGVATTGNKFNFTPSASRARIPSEYR